jgi:hypothetical protein
VVKTFFFEHVKVLTINSRSPSIFAVLAMPTIFVSQQTFWAKFSNHKVNKGCVTLCCLAIYIKKYLKAKEEEL